MQLLHPPLGARKHLIKSRFYHRKIPLAPLPSCLFTTTPATSRAQFSSNKSKWLSSKKITKYAPTVTSSLAFGCQKTLNGHIPLRLNTARPSIADIPQPPLTSPFWSFLFLFVASQFPIVSWGYCGRHTQPSAQEHGDISAQCARH